MELVGDKIDRAFISEVVLRDTTSEHTIVHIVVFVTDI